MIITEIEPPNVHIPAKNCGTSYEMEAEKGWKIKYSANYRDTGKNSRPCFTSTSYTKLDFSCSRISVESFSMCHKACTVSLMYYV